MVYRPIGHDVLKRLDDVRGYRRIRGRIPVDATGHFDATYQVSNHGKRFQDSKTNWKQQLDEFKATIGRIKNNI